MEQDIFGSYNRLKKKTSHSYWEKRILSQIGYLIGLCYHKDEKARELLDQAVLNLTEEYRKNGQIGVSAARETEELLLPLSQQAKSITIICAAHAHIDMNWMWGYQETVNVTIDTMRTMLTLMEEYPQYTFSQSQASVYQILEKYAPEMLAQVKERIREGRWEVTASAWVENDKNMPDGESLTRHLLCTRNYLSNLLDIDEKSLNLDFEPDTFGHSYNLPEILEKGGVSRYYQCRGYDGEHIYRWRGMSGAEILVYREPMWYNAYIDGDMFGIVPSICEKYGLTKMLKVYGVGDHGGGPTRRDLDALLDMGTWPLLPSIKFGTFREFFDYLETKKETFPVVNQELNYLFTGCYTSQSRIKMANRIGECRLKEAEILDSMASLKVPSYQNNTSLKKAWQKILFNQFHDILPGSGTVETREYAMGQFQEAMALTSAHAGHAMQALCAAVTDSKNLSLTADYAMGAGVGMGSSQADRFGFSLSERGSGSKRYMALFNVTQTDSTEPFEIVLWDWTEDLAQTRITDPDGREYPMQVLEKGIEYTGHRYDRLLVWMPVPALGYTVCCIDTKNAPQIDIARHVDILTEQITDEPLCLENDKIRALFDPKTMKCISLIRKADQTALIVPEKSACGFSLITEETSNGMTSWRVGRTAAAVDLNESRPVFPTRISLTGRRKELCYQITEEDGTRLEVQVCLDEGSSFLKYRATVIWTKLGTVQKGIPQLRFQVPCAYQPAGYRYAIPAGFIDRPALAQDVPSIGVGCALPETGDGALCLLCDTKYGFRGDNEGLSLNLIRSSYDPDPYPEIGTHIIRMAVGVCDPAEEKLALCAQQFFHPIITRSCAGKPIAAGTEKCFAANGAVVSAIKPAQDGRGLIVRVYNPVKTGQTLTLTLPGRTFTAYRCDSMEHDLEQLQITPEGAVTQTLKGCEVCSFRLIPVID